MLPLLLRRNGVRPLPRLLLYHNHHARLFHDYFVTHLPSSSLHPDARSASGPHHKLPRDKSVPHVPQGSDRMPAAMAPSVGVSRDMTVVRIPLKSAKHHFGAALSRGSRPYNEDTYQAGTIEIPAFARRRPMSFTRKSKGWGGGATSADSSVGDPQVFYFGVFDGHGGNECSDFLRERLQDYIEEGARQFELESTLQGGRRRGNFGFSSNPGDAVDLSPGAGKRALDSIKMVEPDCRKPLKTPEQETDEDGNAQSLNRADPPKGMEPVKQSEEIRNAEELERCLVNAWRELVGGYFKRFKPEYFSLGAGGRGHILEKDLVQSRQMHTQAGEGMSEGVGIETVLEWAFLKADYDFVAAQADKTEDVVASDRALNEGDILGKPSQSHKPIGGPKRFRGGSTCSIALISTPTPSPFWHPASPSTLVTSHVGDTRILLCKTSDGIAVPMTSDHHPSDPLEAARLRRYAATFVTDSFGEERVQGLANTRAFGDMSSKRIGVTAEPEIRRMELEPAEYSFLVLVSDGISGILSDQEVVDIAKEARTPEQGARDIVSFATEVAVDADNATALVVRLGGWERRSEGGLGSMGTKEMRNWRKQEAQDPRRRQ
ncbi:protein serine/threonine phosphatase 2C [Rhizodiscina lignyota]|uniref:Protein serine/threonine phosphatase 2C n=1 Tax=Rhizodiscina lignyota TaxID=1504668 RepID=A0A9P4MAZ5_9PEZI|nr:protein serine/threonine phosphatase 2C [Rhizodiscina lignyota]